MTECFSIDQATVVLDNELLHEGAVDIRNGEIVGIRSPGVKSAWPNAPRIDARGAFLAPGFIDLHIHGMHEFLVDRGPADLAAMSRILPRYGVTGWLPTVCPRPKGDDARFLSQLAATRTTGAAVFGYHLEGPFLALTGALPPEALGEADTERVESLIKAAGRYPAIFSVSPDFKRIGQLIRVMASTGAPVFMTHTRASVAETCAAIDAGARHATHFYDVFPVPSETDPGVRPCGAVEAILADPRVSVDFILDGVHVDPVAVKMALQCKGPDRVCLITDAMVGAGLPPGTYRAGGVDVVFSEPGGPARKASNAPRPGGLCGSGLTMNLAVRNAVRLGGISLPLAVRLASANPARVLGLEARHGRIAEGRPADLVLFDENFAVLQTWISGVSIYRKEGQ